MLHSVKDMFHPGIQPKFYRLPRVLESLQNDTYSPHVHVRLMYYTPQPLISILIFLKSVHHHFDELNPPLLVPHWRWCGAYMLDLQLINMQSSAKQGTRQGVVVILRLEDLNARDFNARPSADSQGCQP